MQCSHVDGLGGVQSTTVDEVLQSRDIKRLVLLAEAVGEGRRRKVVGMGHNQRNNQGCYSPEYLETTKGKKGGGCQKEPNPGSLD